MIQKSQELGCQFVLQTPNQLSLQPPSLQICLKPAVNLILMVQHLSLSHALSPPHLSFPPLLSAFPNAVTKLSFSLPCIISVSREPMDLSGQAGKYR